MKVFVIGTNKKPLDPVHPAEAILLLNQQKASVFRQYTVTIIFKQAFQPEEPQAEPLRITIDPGSRTTSEIVCGKTDIPLKSAHIHPSRGDSNRVSNLTLAFTQCNQQKNIHHIEQFLSNKSELLNRILRKARAQLCDAAAVTATRWDLYHTQNMAKANSYPKPKGLGFTAKRQIL